MQGKKDVVAVVGDGWDDMGGERLPLRCDASFWRKNGGIGCSRSWVRRLGNDDLHEPWIELGYGVRARRLGDFGGWVVKG